MDEAGHTQAVGQAAGAGSRPLVRLLDSLLVRRRCLDALKVQDSIAAGPAPALQHGRLVEAEPLSGSTAAVHGPVGAVVLVLEPLHQSLAWLLHLLRKR